MKFLEIFVNFLITWIVFAIIISVFYFAWFGVLTGLEVWLGFNRFISFVALVALFAQWPAKTGFVFSAIGIFTTFFYLGWPLWQIGIIYLPAIMIGTIMLSLSFVMAVVSTCIEVFKYSPKK